MQEPEGQAKVEVQRPEHPYSMLAAHPTASRELATTSLPADDYNTPQGLDGIYSVIFIRLDGPVKQKLL